MSKLSRDWSALVMGVIILLSIAGFSLLMYGMLFDFDHSHTWMKLVSLPFGGALLIMFIITVAITLTDLFKGEK